MVKADCRRPRDIKAYKKNYDAIFGTAKRTNGKGRRLKLVGDKWIPVGEAPIVRQMDNKRFRSSSAGVNPDQIPELMSKFPDHKYHPVTGDMLFRDRQHKKKCLQQIGMFDHDETWSGRNV